MLNIKFFICAFYVFTLDIVAASNIEPNIREACIGVELDQHMQALEDAYSAMMQDKKETHTLLPATSTLKDIFLCRTNIDLYEQFKDTKTRNFKFSDKTQLLFEEHITTYNENQAPFFVMLKKLQNRQYSLPQSFLLSGSMFYILTNISLAPTTKQDLFFKDYIKFYMSMRQAK